MSFEYILSSLAISLFLTLILELTFSLFFKLKSKALLLTVLVNILTNPAVVILFLLLCRYYSLSEFAVIAVLEIIAVIIEGMIYKTGCAEIKRPFLFSLGANTFSYICGAVISSLI